MRLTNKNITSKKDNIIYRKTMARDEIQQYWREKQNSRRQKLIDEHGLEWVRQQEANKKKQQRLKKKANEIVANPTESKIEKEIVKLQTEQIKKHSNNEKIIEQVGEGVKTNIKEAVKNSMDGKVVKVRDIVEKSAPSAVLVHIANIQSMDDFVKHLSKESLKKESKQIKEKTLRDYCAKIRHLFKLMFGGPIKWNNLDFLKDVKKVENFATGHWNSGNSTLLSYFIAITGIVGRLSGFSEAHKEYNKVMMELKKKNDEKVGENELSDKEKSNFIPWQEVKKITPKTPQDTLIYHLYVSLPPRRNEDYQLMKIIFGKKVDIKALPSKYNYYLRDMNKLVFKRYKTDYVFNNKKENKEYEGQVIDLKSKDTDYVKYSNVRKAFNTYLEEYKFDDEDILFPTRADKFQKNWSAVVRKVFTYGKKKLGTQLLRHSFISWFLKKNPNVNTRSVIADLMAHSLTTQMMYEKFENKMVLVFDD